MKNLEEIGLSMYSITSDGKVFSRRCGRFLKGWLCSGGYPSTSLIKDDGTILQTKIHRIVAEFFCQNDSPLTKTQVNHKDGVKTNNHYLNLEWCTPSENTQHAHDISLNKGKSFNDAATIDDSQVIHNPYEKCEVSAYEASEDCVREVCSLIQEGYRDVDISRIVGLNRRYICNIRHNTAKVWESVVQEYNFSFTKEERLSPEKVVQVCQMLEAGGKVLKIARDLELCRKQVGNIKNRKTFKSISSGYKF
jgi:hypothetical protein